MILFFSAYCKLTEHKRVPLVYTCRKFDSHLNRRKIEKWNFYIIQYCKFDRHLNQQLTLKFFILSGLQHFCWIIGYNILKKPNNILNKENIPTEILVSFAYLGCIVYILRYSKKEKKDSQWALTWSISGTLFSIFFCSNCWLGLQNFIIFS